MYCFWFLFFFSTDSFSHSRIWLWSVSYFPGNYGKRWINIYIYIFKKQNTCKKIQGSMYVFYCLYSVYSCCPCCLCANVVGEIYIWPLMQLFCGVVQECINMKIKKNIWLFFYIYPENMQSALCFLLSRISPWLMFDLPHFLSHSQTEQ